VIWPPKARLRHPSNSGCWTFEMPVWSKDYCLLDPIGILGIHKEIEWIHYAFKFSNDRKARFWIISASHGVLFGGCSPNSTAKSRLRGTPCFAFLASAYAPDFWPAEAREVTLHLYRRVHPQMVHTPKWSTPILSRTIDFDSLLSLINL